MMQQHSQAQGVKKIGYSRNQPNLGQGPGTAGTLLQGGPGKQQMNYTSYEGGFQGSRGNSAIGQGGPQ